MNYYEVIFAELALLQQYHREMADRTERIIDACETDELATVFIKKWRHHGRVATEIEWAINDLGGKRRKTA